MADAFLPFLLTAALQYLPGGQYQTAAAWNPDPGASMLELGAMASGPDADRDGWPDFLTTEIALAPFGAREGRARVWSGRDGSPLWARSFDRPEYFGRAACALGDINGDGIREFAISDPERNNDLLSEGTVWILSGGDGATLVELHGTSTRDAMFGSAIAPIADLDFDGVGDLIVGSEEAQSGAIDFAGEVYVHSGATGARIRTFQLPNPERTDLLGASVLGLGDLDGDGVPDLVCGSPTTEPGADFDVRGMAVAFSGATGLLLWRHDGIEVDESCGQSLALLSDLDSDGYAEVAVGCDFGHAYPVPGPGKVEFLSGRTGQRVGGARGENVSDRFGTKIIAIPDVDRDGLTDLVALEPWLQRPTGRGGFALVSARSGAILEQVAGTVSEHEFAGAFSFHPAWGEDRLPALTAAAWVPAAGGQPERDEVAILVREPFLRADREEVSASLGGVTRLNLSFPFGEARLQYLVTGTLAGLGTSILLGIEVPIRTDDYTLRMLNGTAPGFSGLHGRLSASAEAVVTWDLAPGAPVELVGRTATFCAVTHQNFLGRASSLPVIVRFEP